VASFHSISPTWKCDWPSSPVKRRMSLIDTLTFPRFVEPPAPQGLEFPALLYALQALVYRLAQCGARAGERNAELLAGWYLLDHGELAAVLDEPRDDREQLYERSNAPADRSSRAVRIPW
jgi:hypothetical protein